ncbi:hypothetical protein BBJ28_00001513 [Nothophytophthora sp. Chile5]|nr:hypothetical protein BBJ28_00001513 [Nothophytophthora sp. Chile5]
MGFFGTAKRQTREPGPSTRPAPLSVAAETTIVYTGGALCVTLQRAKSRYLVDETPTRVCWVKTQRLGLTFFEMPGGGVAVKDVQAADSDISVGQELIGVDSMPVAGLDLQSVIQLLRAAQSPCMLDFTPPPSPIVVSEVLAPAMQLGVQRGMVLKAANGGSMIGAALSDVGAVIHGASDRSPVQLTFAPYDSVIRHRARRSSSVETSGNSHSSLRNTLCLGAVVAAITL